MWWNKSNFFTHLALESNKAVARSYLSPCGHWEDSKLRHPATRHLSDKLHNCSSVIDLAEDCVLNCLEKGGSSVLMNTVDIWIIVWKVCLMMMAADLRKPALDPSDFVLRSSFFVYKSLQVVIYCPQSRFQQVLSSRFSYVQQFRKQMNFFLQSC